MCLCLQFAVGYNRRGVQETEIKTFKVSLNDTDVLSLLDRNRCFDTVARGVKEVVSDSVVDLKSPEVEIMITSYASHNSFTFRCLLCI